MKIVLAAILAALLAGCMTPHSVSYKYTPTPHPELAGYWVGSATGQTHTMLLRPDGTGELCWEYLGKYNTTPVTISGEKIIGMSEAKFKINPDGTISQCAWGMCLNFQRTEHVAAACREWLSK
ncbi:J517_1871 family lipoprotein [Rugamonas sp.]|uniref:J517_1871 family lipoprotein n=1 Tax=Rugamonas sp. TaxID=1926287 RepID=UPI0025CCA186|nr:J517_1871 family lipoprotein [Rugamonas sp.]